MGNRGRGAKEMAYIRSKEQLENSVTKPLFSEKTLTRKEKADAFRFLAAQNLSKRGLHPFFEVVLDLSVFDWENMCYLNYLWGRRADVLALGRGFGITIVEVKSSISDFNSDHKWNDYLKACDSFYFCSDQKTIKHISEAIKGHEKERKIGLMTCDLENMKLEVTKSSRCDESLEIPDSIRRLIVYKSLVAADVFFNGSYSARIKPAFSYVGKPYE